MKKLSNTEAELKKSVVYKKTCITTNIQRGVLWKKFSETFKQTPRQIPKKKFIFSTVAVSKNQFIHMYFSRFLLKV